jgi:hypothetical protein
MASIILSFVGNQDPVSDKNQDDGSIVSLVRHLRDKGESIKRILLLYTDATRDRAELTQGWLADEPLNVDEDYIDCLPVDAALSDDPVSVTLAVQAARQGLEAAIAHCESTDRLEMNASSGTPVMKSAWSILQAAGYARRSRVWQVRNPQEQRPGQARVFEANMQALRQEFDIRVIKQQLNDYNFSGALVSLQGAGLATPTLEGLLQYGHRRLSLDFRGARQAIAPVEAGLARRWMAEVQRLVEPKDAIALLQEAYFNAVTELKNHKFSDFLVRVFQFQEKALQHCVNQSLRLLLPRRWEETHSFWQSVQAQHPALMAYLRDYHLESSASKSYPLKLDGFLNRPTCMAMLTYFNHPLLSTLDQLNQFCDQRNRYVHQFEGVSHLDDPSTILNAMKAVLTHEGATYDPNPFNDLRQDILDQLSQGMV